MIIIYLGCKHGCNHDEVRRAAQEERGRREGARAEGGAPTGRQGAHNLGIAKSVERDLLNPTCVICSDQAKELEENTIKMAHDELKTSRAQQAEAR
jgi:hypothetical protein